MGIVSRAATHHWPLRPQPATKMTMHTGSELGIKHRKKWLPWVIGVSLLLYVGYFLFQLLGPDSKIIVSKETTYITEPLADDGLPDLEAYIIDSCRDGVTPENNAAVLLWQAIWPGELSEEQRPWMIAALGIEEVPSEEDALVDPFGQSNLDRIGQWLSIKYSAPEDQDPNSWLYSLGQEMSYSVVEEALESAWTRDQIPPLANWVDENGAPLDLLLEASKRPKYFSPSPSYLDGVDESLVYASLPTSNLCGPWPGR